MNGELFTVISSDTIYVWVKRSGGTVRDFTVLTPKGLLVFWAFFIEKYWRHRRDKDIQVPILKANI